MPHHKIEDALDKPERIQPRVLAESQPPATAETVVNREKNVPGNAENTPPTEKSSLIKKLPAFVRRASPPPLPTAGKDAITIKVEKIMESDLSEAYNRLSPIAKQEFKIKGEATAAKINELLKSAHVKAKKIFRLIFEWLKLLPGVNKFFLEQEAKIKTDRIIELHNSRKQ